MLAWSCDWCPKYIFVIFCMPAQADKKTRWALSSFIVEPTENTKVHWLMWSAKKKDKDNTFLLSSSLPLSRCELPVSQITNWIYWLMKNICRHSYWYIFSKLFWVPCCVNSIVISLNYMFQSFGYSFTLLRMLLSVWITPYNNSHQALSARVVTFTLLRMLLRAPAAVAQ